MKSDLLITIEALSESARKGGQSKPQRVADDAASATAPSRLSLAWFVRMMALRCSADHRGGPVALDGQARRVMAHVSSRGTRPYDRTHFLQDEEPEAESEWLSQPPKN